jgi:hypothetical protein
MLGSHKFGCPMNIGGWEMIKQCLQNYTIDSLVETNILVGTLEANQYSKRLY